MARASWPTPASVALALILLLGGPLAAPAAGVAPRPEVGGGDATVGTVALTSDRPDGIAVPEGADVGWLTVPALGLERFPIRMGTTDEVLADAVGLYPGSEPPGEGGNFGTAGHRVTPVAGMGHGPYYDLDLLEPGDELVLGFRGETYRYRFTGSAIVSPADVWVLDDDRADLTMTACHPKGSVAERIIAWWDEVEPDGAAMQGAAMQRAALVARLG